MHTSDVVPSTRLRSGHDALLEISSSARHLSGAVAFVTVSGVELIAKIRAERPDLPIELVARGAPITEPEALERLADLDVAVSAVIGRSAPAFHPKLWLADRGDGLDVLSGSGNLTASGLSGNVEQFELLRFPASETQAIAQHQLRLSLLTRGATPLEAVRTTNYWRRWKLQSAERKRLAQESERLDRELTESAGADEELALLRADLYGLYEQTKAEVTLVASDGSVRPYVATYFKRALDRCDETGGPLSLASRIVKSPTEGFERLAEAHRPELLVESLVLDESKPYHHRFPAETVARAQRNMDRYDEIFRTAE